jgi:hypothetical protein
VWGHPPTRVGGGELPLPPLGYPTAMLSTRAQRRRETVYGWADMHEELLAEVLEAAGWQEGGFWGSLKPPPGAAPGVRWVKAVYDALVRRLVLRRQTTDEAMGMLLRCFPAVASVAFK